MKFSNESIEMLLDLVEIKISSLFVYDKEDSKELKKLKKEYYSNTFKCFFFF